MQQAQDKHREYKDTLHKMIGWLGGAEGQMRDIQSGSVGAAPTDIQGELDTVKAFNMESIAHGKTLDELKRTCKGLTDKLKDLGADEHDLKSITNSVDGVGDRLGSVTTQSTSKANELQTALVESQGVREGLDNLLTWVKEAETTLSKMKAISLSQDTLDNQIQDVHMLQSDIESHTPSVDKVNKAAEDLIRSGTDPNKARDIKKKLTDLNERFGRITVKCDERDRDTSDVADKLAIFNDAVRNFEDWVEPALDVLESKDTSQMETPAFKDKIGEIGDESGKKTDNLELVNQLGKALVQNPKTADVSGIKSKVTECGKTWQDFDNLLREREREVEYREKQSNQYEALREEVQQWLVDMDNYVDNLEPVAIDLEVVEKQIDELKVS